MTVLLIAIGGFLLGAVLTSVGTGILSIFGVNVLEQPSLRIVISALALQGLGFGSVAVFYLLTHNKGVDFLMLSMPDFRDLLAIVGGVVSLFVVLVGVYLVQTTFGIQSADHGLVKRGMQSPEILLILVPLSILLVGPGEELLFRGVIQQLLRFRFGAIIGITIASVIFSVAHVGSLSGEGLIPSLVTYFLLSVILGVSYEYSENLIVPSLIHGLFNAAQFLIVYVRATGNLPISVI
ncbi:CPBP family intramembrane glutamic endopeptidase [Halalkalicoccus subterraneus]|uniref:CPBP family intramembrane glutamic endopeptidase n=1 Tax=Halalkalicoccus subterraneus TaxID=2675002 RepID=UPI001FEAEAE9|nr:type II CAAX endopeptidase family protein [Halalkalicoccus subterraneus]